MSALARCWGVVGNPGGDLGDRAAAGGAAETRGGVHGVGADDAELVVAVGGDALGVGGSGGGTGDSNFCNEDVLIMERETHRYEHP